VGKGAELDVDRPRDVAGLELGSLGRRDVPTISSGRRVGSCDRAARRSPDVDARRVTDDALMSDVEALRTNSSRSAVAGDDDDWPFELSEPAEPAGEHRSQRVRQRTGHVTGGELGHRSHVDDQGAGVDVALDGVDVEPVEPRELRGGVRRLSSQAR
jgi:hypothetical protein